MDIICISSVSVEIIYSYGHLLVISGDFYGMIYSINGVLLVLMMIGISGHNCKGHL